METRRLLFVVNAFEYDAPTRLLVDVATAAREAGYECRIVAIARSGPFEQEVKDRGFETEVIGMKGLVDTGTIGGFRKMIRRMRPDLVHLTLLRPTIVGGLSMPSDTPFVITHNGSHEWAEGGGVASKIVPTLHRLAAGRAKAVIAVSRAAQQELINNGTRSDKSVVIYNGVHERLFSPQPSFSREHLPELKGWLKEEDILVGAAGNLRQIKGHATVIEAARLICPHYKNVRFMIWGEGPERNRMESMIRRYGLEDRVRLPGQSREMDKCLAACDIYVQPSLREAFGLAAAEAMACGRPVVVSNAGGLPELVEHEKSGLVFHGEATGLADHLKNLITNQALRHAIGTAARQRIVDHFTIERMQREHLALYQDVMDGTFNTGSMAQDTAGPHQTTSATHP